MKDGAIMRMNFNAIQYPETITNRQPKPNQHNWKEVLQSLKIHPEQHYKEPPICIEFNGKDGLSRFASLGNFSLVIGKAKSRKTFLISTLLSAAIKKDLFNIRASLPIGKERVVYFDTEQSNYDVWRVVKRILAGADIIKPINFDAFGLRSLEPKDREFVIDQFLNNSDDIGLVVIDGIRDLINDINSPEESTHIASKLLKWTEEGNIHIITVLHQNKGDNNARGHIGAELTNKAETVISVEKDNNISIVRPEFVRGKDFEPFAFAVDERGLPYIFDDWKEANKKITKQKFGPYEVARETHIKILKEMFFATPQKKYKDLEADLKVIFQKYSIRLNSVQVVEFISYYRINNMVKDTGGKGRSGNQYSLHESIT